MMRSDIFSFSLVLAAVLAGGNLIPAHSATRLQIVPPASRGPGNVAASAESSKPGAQIIVIGFVGGYVRHDDPVHSGVQLASRLRDDYPSGVYINTFENHQG